MIAHRHVRLLGAKDVASALFDGPPAPRAGHPILATTLEPGRGRGPVLALHLPADDRIPVGLVRLTVVAAAFSDAIGGGLLDDTVDGLVNGYGYVVYLDEHRVRKGLPSNQRAAVLRTHHLPGQRPPGRHTIA